MGVPTIIKQSFCRHCHVEIGGFHTALCPTGKCGVDYRDVAIYKFRLMGKLR